MTDRPPAFAVRRMAAPGRDSSDLYLYLYLYLYIPPPNPSGVEAELRSTSTPSTHVKTSKINLEGEAAQPSAGIGALGREF